MSVDRTLKLNELKRQEEQGKIADSLDVRTALMNRVQAGEITLQEAQQELKVIKTDAKRNGLVTRDQFWGN